MMWETLHLVHWAQAFQCAQCTLGPRLDTAEVTGPAESDSSPLGMQPAYIHPQVGSTGCGVGTGQLDDHTLLLICTGLCAG